MQLRIKTDNGSEYFLMQVKSFEVEGDEGTEVPAFIQRKIDTGTDPNTGQTYSGQASGNVNING